MAHTFKNISAKPTFNSINNLMTQNDIINKRKQQHLFCLTNKNQCNKMINAHDYNQYYLFKDYSVIKCDKMPVHKNSLVSGQYTSLDLNNVCVASKNHFTNTTISCDKNIAMNVDANGNWNGGMSSFYDDVFIDPFGQLFGLSQCGELNFTEHMTL
jgi:hypothetical protein